MGTRPISSEVIRDFGARGCIMNIVVRSKGLKAVYDGWHHLHTLNHTTNQPIYPLDAQKINKQINLQTHKQTKQTHKHTNTQTHKQPA